MSKVLILKGLPASGKSTYAKKLVDAGWKRVNKDDLRAMLDNAKHTKGNENFVVRVRDFIITQAILAGKNVVVDDTNFNPEHEAAIRNIVAAHPSCEVEVKFIDTSLKECIKRNALRANGVPEAAIHQMYNKYLAPKLRKVTPPEGKPRAIIVDIDGTLAHMVPQSEGGRSPYDYTRVSEDIVDETVRSVVKRYYDDNYQVLIVSGREADCRDVTEKWLADNNVPYHHFWMRKAGDSRHDGIVKQEIFDEHIRNDYHVEFVLDDRNRVVQMWRSGGLKVLQVADGDF